LPISRASGTTIRHLDAIAVGGIPTSHQVGIYNDSTQVLVGSAVVNYDGTSASGSSFTYTAVTPFVLAANTTYDIAASNLCGTSTTIWQQLIFAKRVGGQRGVRPDFGTFALRRQQFHIGIPH
jgi:hypothetical protein